VLSQPLPWPCAGITALIAERYASPLSRTLHEGPQVLLEVVHKHTHVRCSYASVHLNDCTSSITQLTAFDRQTSKAMVLGFGNQFRQSMSGKRRAGTVFNTLMPQHGFARGCRADE